VRLKTTESGNLCFAPCSIEVSQQSLECQCATADGDLAPARRSHAWLSQVNTRRTRPRSGRARRLLIDEADWITELVHRPEHEFSPRHTLDASIDNRAAGIDCSVAGCNEIRNGEVDILPRMMLSTPFQAVAIGRWIVASEHRSTAIEVMPAWRGAPAGHPKNERVKGVRFFDVSYRKDYTK
jgi:hypothetical protein